MTSIRLPSFVPRWKARSVLSMASRKAFLVANDIVCLFLVVPLGWGVGAWARSVSVTGSKWMKIQDKINENQPSRDSIHTTKQAIIDNWKERSLAFTFTFQLETCQKAMKRPRLWYWQKSQKVSQCVLAQGVNNTWCHNTWSQHWIKLLQLTITRPSWMF